MRKHDARAIDARSELLESGGPVESAELPSVDLGEAATGRRCAAELLAVLGDERHVSSSVVYLATTLRRHVAARLDAVEIERRRSDPLVAADYRRIGWHLRQLDEVAARLEEGLGNVVLSGGVLGELERAVLVGLVETVATGLAEQLDREHDAAMRAHWEDIGGG